MYFPSSARRCGPAARVIHATGPDYNCYVCESRGKKSPGNEDTDSKNIAFKINAT